MTDLSYTELVSHFIKLVPEYKRIYDHEIDYYGDISLWTFFGSILVDFTRDKFQLWKTSQDEASYQVVTTILNFVEQCASSDTDEITGLIQTSFIEALYLFDADYDEFTKLLGTKSGEMLVAVEEGWGKLKSRKS